MSTLRSWIRRTALFVVFVSLAASPLQASGQQCEPEDSKITINHRLGTVSPDGTVRLRHDQWFCIEIVNTDESCILVNFQELPPSLQAAAGGPPVAFRVQHHEDIGSYKVTIGIKDHCKTKTPRLDPLERVIPVETYGWTLGLAGAFTADGLTDPVFFLDQGERSKPGEPETSETGFFVRERSSAQDDAKLGAATFMHLYHNNQNKFGRGGVNWVPLSFGLGIGDSSQAKYFLGTGIRFGTRAFLTAGLALGARERLPDSLEVGLFTTDQNALKTLPQKTTEEWFLSLSFRGLDIDVSRLSAPFKKQATPSPK